METFKCQTHDCTQPAESIYHCRKPPVALCSSHREEHLLLHRQSDQCQWLTEQECTAVGQAYLALKLATLNYLVQILQETLTNISQRFTAHWNCLEIIRKALRTLQTLHSNELEGILQSLQSAFQRCVRCQHCKPYFHKMQLITQQSHRMVLSLNCAQENDRLPAVQALFKGVRPSEWVSQGFEREQIVPASKKKKPTRVLQDQEDTYRVDHLPLRRQRSPLECTQPLKHHCSAPLTSDSCADQKQIAAAIQAYLEMSHLTTSRGPIRSNSDFDILLDLPFLNCVSPTSLLEALHHIEGKISYIEAYTAFINVFLTEVPEYFLTSLAFAALDDGVIDVHSWSHLNIQSAEIKRLLKVSPLVLVNSTTEQYRFVHSSIRDFLVAQTLVKELESTDIGFLDPGLSLNRYKVAQNPGVRWFAAEIMRPKISYFEKVLLDIVIQTKKRSDCSLASATAITLLNQLEFCFVRRKLTQIKIPGADLSGADLTKTDFSCSDLQEVIFEKCKLLKTKFYHSNLAGTKFGKALPPLKGHSDYVETVCFSSTGTIIASGSHDKQVILWDPTSGLELSRLNGHSSAIKIVSFSPDSTLLASGSCDTTISLWETANGQRAHVLRGHGKPVTDLRFWPDSARMNSTSIDRTVLVWNVATGESLHSIQVPALASGTYFSPNGRLAISDQLKKSVILWEIASGYITREFPDPSFQLRTVCFSHDGELVVLASALTTAGVKSTSTGEHLYTLEAGECGLTSVTFSPSDQFIAGGSFISIIVWDTKTGDELLVQKFCNFFVIKSMCFSPDNSRIVSGAGTNSIFIWEPTLNPRSRSIQGHTDLINAVSFSPDQRLIASGSNDKTVMLWDTFTGRRVYTLTKHTDAVTAVRFFPSGAFVASGSKDGTIIVWETATGQQTLLLQAHSEMVTSLDFSADGKFMLSASEDRTIKLWKARTGESVHTRVYFTERVEAVAFSPSSERYASTCNRSVTVWSTRGCQKRESFISRLLTLVAVCFSSDGKLLATGDEGGLVVLQDSTTGEQMITNVPHSAKVTKLAFLANTTLLLSSSLDCTVAVWDIATDQSIRASQGQFEQTTAVDFSADGKLVVSAHADTKLIVSALRLNLKQLT